MKIAVFGAGGVGGYFGGRLAQAGLHVTFIARGRHLQAMRAGGLRLSSLKGDFTAQPVQATDTPAQVGPVDVVLVAVKAWQIDQAAQAMQPMIGPETVVIPLQNGVEAPARLAAVLGRAHVLGGFCRIVSFVAGPGHIRQTGGDPYMAFGELDNRPSPRVAHLVELFNGAPGMTVENPPNIRAAMWAKYLLISAWSALGAVTRAPVGVWRAVPETRQMWLAAMREVYAVAQANNVALPADIVETSAAYVDTLPGHATASMQRDILDGRPSELDTLCGGVARLGAEVGVPTPVHTFMYHALLPQELKARGRLKFPEPA
jgi:2-dehydropantoate 2-reductase